MATRSWQVLLILCDSRGAHLQPLLTYQLEIQRIGNVTFQISHYPGATIEVMVEREIPKLKVDQYDLIYVMGGVCNLSYKHLSKRLSPVYLEPGNLVDCMLNKFIKCREETFKKRPSGDPSGPTTTQRDGTTA